MINNKTYYQILGVTPDAEDIVIRAAYKVLSQRYHPGLMWIEAEIPTMESWLLKYFLKDAKNFCWLS